MAWEGRVLGVWKRGGDQLVGGVGESRKGKWRESCPQAPDAQSGSHKRSIMEIWLITFKLFIYLYILQINI